MKKLFTLLCFSFLFCVSSFSQDFLGYINSNYSGVLGTDLQPASSADSRFKFDIIITGFSLGINNNFIGINHDAFAHNGKRFDFSNDNYPAFIDTSFAKHYVTLKDNSKTKKLYLQNQIYLPSFLITINKRNAIAVKWKVRSIFNVDGLGQELATLMLNNLRYPSLLNQQLHNTNLSLQTMTWAEYGINYAHVFRDKDQHFFSAGVTVKLIQGIQAAYLYVKDMSYNFTSDTSVALFHTDANYGHSSVYDQQSTSFKDIYKFSNLSVGFDLGAVYEWRPDYQKFKYDMDNQTGLDRRDLNKYKLRVGISVLDIGSVKYQKGQGSRDFTADIPYWNIHQVSPSSLTSFDDTLKYRFYKGDTTSIGTFKMHLPTVLTMQIDYNIWKDFYLNLTPYYAFLFKNSATKVHELSSITLTPRWDHRYFGAFVPLSYDAMGRFKVGLGLRLGPLVFGTSNVIPFVSKNPVYGADFQVMLRCGMKYKKVKDRDGDKVSDKLDLCKDVPGVWEFRGCPDKDGDHVPDKDDLCPDVAGLPEFHGCPDTDGDGIPDREDECPTVKGLAQFHGCPDTDNDSIPDKDDDCPTEAGPAKYKGCPDRDGDGIIDKLDQCPDKPGPASNNGCPEVKLTLLDSLDHDLRTSIQNKDGSFSFADLPSDDKVKFKINPDAEDNLLDIKIVVGGIAKRAIRDKKGQYFHFIVLKTEVATLDKKIEKDVAIKLDTAEQAVVAKAFSNLEFASGKDIILPASYKSLDELATLLKKKSKWRLRISGHTDNVGQADANMKLSQKRAEAVQKYLVSKGIDTKRFKVEYFGATVPIADNKTEEGRQKNRRVEMLIIK